MVLVYSCIKWAFERRLDVDFSAGAQHYTDYWTRVSYRAHSPELACSVWGATRELGQAGRYVGARAA